MKVKSSAIFLLLLAPVIAAKPEDEIRAKVPQAREILNAWQSKDPVRADKSLHIVYWSPADREPAPLYQERLGAIMEEIRNFYAREMERLGFGPLTIRLDHADDGGLKVHLVKGSQPYSHYTVGSGGEIRKDCLPVLRAAGVDPDKETIVIFCNMANWDPAKRSISQNSPYYAAGTNRRGTAWQVDSPILNLASLPDKEARVRDGQYGDISIGRYNSIFIGGICHELGHALGLPHNCERTDERQAFGTALMGSGNRTYGEELRGEGKGSFLTLAHGLRLSSHPLFCGSVKGIDRPSNAEICDVEITGRGKSFTLSARVKADPPVYAVIGYMDPKGGGDYNATTCTAVPDAAGRFTLEANALAAGKPGVLRVVCLQANGAANSFASANSRITFPYDVGKGGLVDLSAAQAGILLAPLLAALDGSAASIEVAMMELEESAATPVILDAAKVLVESVGFKPGPAPKLAQGNVCALPGTMMKSAKVGYGRAVPNRLPDGALFICGSRLFPRGLYAHAPSRHVWELGGKWKTLRGHAGLPDGRRGGSCIFSIKADGREIWRSKKTEPGALLSYKVSVDGVNTLEFSVENAGDGNGSDWGCWLDPRLGR